MTVKELSQIYYLNKEIERDEEELKHLRDRLYPGSPSSDGMPHASSFDKSGTEALIAEIVDLEHIIWTKQQQRMFEHSRLTRYINGIEDAQTRLIFKTRFLDVRSWEDVAAAVGGGNTEGSVKMICHRYLRAHAQ